MSTSGKFYQSLAGFIGKTNRTLQNTPTVTPSLARNPKIVDAREASLFAAYVSPDPDIETVASSVETTPDRIYGE